jgi:hypothetical protein
LSDCRKFLRKLDPDDLVEGVSGSEQERTPLAGAKIDESVLLVMNLYVPNHFVEEGWADSLVIHSCRPVLPNNSELSQTDDTTCVNTVRLVEVTVLFAGAGKPCLKFLIVLLPRLWHQDKAGKTLDCPC